MTGLLIAMLLSGGVGSAPGVTMQKAGVRVGRAQTLNLTGTGVTSCTQSGAVTTCTITDTSGAGNLLEVSIAFGAPAADEKTVTVTGQAWVTASSKIVCSVFGKTTVGDNDYEDPSMEALSVQATNRVAGVGFDLVASSPDSVVGTFFAHCSGQ